jgi:hypothetical protein
MNAFVLVTVEKGDPIVKLGKDYIFAAKKLFTIKTAAGEIDVPIFDEDYFIENDNVHWITAADFLSSPLVLSVVDIKEVA